MAERSPSGIDPNADAQEPIFGSNADERPELGIGQEGKEYVAAGTGGEGARRVHQECGVIAKPGR